MNIFITPESHNNISEHKQTILAQLEKLKDGESLTEEEFSGYIKGNILKYVCRYKHKGMPLKDLMKSQWYLERLMREQKTNEE